MKVLKRKLSKGKKLITYKKVILEIIKDFYSNLYSESLEEKDLRTIPHILNQGSEDLPAITTWEVKKSLEEIKNG